MLLLHRINLEDQVGNGTKVVTFGFFWFLCFFLVLYLDRDQNSYREIMGLLTVKPGHSVTGAKEGRESHPQNMNGSH